MGKNRIEFVVINMVTKQEVLEEYNLRNNTKYKTVLELGEALREHALFTTLTEMRKREAAILAESEELD